MTNLEAIWEIIRLNLQRKISNVSFETWFNQSSLLLLDNDQKTITIQVINEFTADWIRRKFISHLKEAFHEELGADFLITVISGFVPSIEKETIPLVKCIHMVDEAIKSLSEAQKLQIIDDSLCTDVNLFDITCQLRICKLTLERIAEKSDLSLQQEFHSYNCEIS